MQFPSLEDEDGDFGLNSASRSRLSSLFQTERASGGDVNQALTFTAPKQPRKNDSNQQSNQGTLKLIHAAAVNAYKLIDGNYTSQGKLGCAILGLHETSNYKLLLYKGKQVQVSTTNILPSFKFHVRPNNYATFYDDLNENWSINFDTESALLNFTKQVALTTANSQDKNQASLVIQDLAQGEGPSLDIGDSAEIKYSGWILSNYTFGQMFDTNMQSESAFRVRLGKKVIKGWSEGLIGAQKGTKRLLVIPPSLAYGAEGMGSSVPPNSTLIFEILVIKAKKSRDSSHSPSPLKVAESVPEKKPEVQPRHSITSEDNIRLRGASISEQLSQSPKKDKAQLISRMAKMGTATLPFQGAVPAQASSDSENEEETQQEKSSPPVQLSGSRTSSPKPLSRPISRKNSEQLTSTQPVQLQSVQESSPFHVSQQPSPLSFYAQPILPNQQPYNTPTNAFPAFQPHITTPYQVPQIQYAAHSMGGPSIADTHLPMLITETRGQNTEVRLSLSKITEKVDTVIQKVDDLRLNQGRSGALSHSPFMDGAMLVQSIEKIVQENSQLKEDVEAKGAKIQSLNEKICDLLQRNQRFFEESNNMLEQRSDTLHAASAESHAKVFSLEKEKAQLTSELSDALRKLGSMEAEIVNHQNQESELRQKFQEAERRIEQLESELQSLRKKSDSESENSSLINSLQNEIKSLRDERNVLTSQLKDWEEKYDLLNKSWAEKIKEFGVLQEQLSRNTSDSNNFSKTENENIESMKMEIENFQIEKREIISKCEDLQTKLSESVRYESLHKGKIKSLQADLQNALAWKEKYEIFYQKTRQMKENYEGERQKLIAELKQTQSSATETSSPDFSGEIKKVMNVLYKLLQGKFESDSSYTGAKVLETTLQAIRGLTIQMLQKKGQRSDTLSKESESAATLLENTASDPAMNSNEVKPENPPSGGGDNVAEVVASVQENGIHEDVSLSSEVPSVPDDAQPSLTHSVEKEFLPENHISSDSKQVDDNHSVEDSAVKNDSTNQSLNHDDVDSEQLSQSSNEDKVQSKTPKNSTEQSKTENQTRVSPDHTQHLSSANISGHSLSEKGNSKVSDGTSDVHA